MNSTKQVKLYCSNLLKSEDKQSRQILKCCSHQKNTKTSSLLPPVCVKLCKACHNKKTLKDFF